MGSTKLIPTTAPWQQELGPEVADYLSQLLSDAGYSGQLPGVAPIPGLVGEAYEDYQAQYGSGISQRAISDLITAKPGFTFDPKATGQRWKETYATPVMAAWQDIVAPMLESQYNIPGGFYSTRKGTGIGRAANEFYGGQVAPTLFSALQTGEQRGFESKEAALGRQPGALGLPGQHFAQAAQVAMTKYGLDEQALTSLFNEFIRTQGVGLQAAGVGAQLSTTPTLNAIVGGKGGTDWAGIATAGALAVATGGLSLPFTGVPGGFPPVTKTMG